MEERTRERSIARKRAVRCTKKQQLHSRAIKRVSEVAVRVVMPRESSRLQSVLIAGCTALDEGERIDARGESRSRLDQQAELAGCRDQLEEHILVAALSGPKR